MWALRMATRISFTAQDSQLGMQPADPKDPIGQTQLTHVADDEQAQKRS
jgi:hypothetical protein